MSSVLSPVSPPVIPPSKLELLTYGYIRLELPSKSCPLKIKNQIILFGSMIHYIGIDLSYSVNKKSYNLLSSSLFAEFCLKSSINIDDINNINITSFGDDNYGIINRSLSSITGFSITNGGKYNIIDINAQKLLNKLDFNNIILSGRDNISSSSNIISFNNSTQNLEIINLNKNTYNKQQFRVKSSIKKLYKNYLLTTNGSLYATKSSFHRKYLTGNKNIIDFKYDGSQCCLCLDYNGSLWSFGNNSFGKLGLNRNNKKQIYTNPRQLDLFKAYKVIHFGLTNRCSIAVCNNDNIYGWGEYTMTDYNKSDIWYTPQLLTPNTGTSIKHKYKYKIFCGFRFILFLNKNNNKLYVSNTEFGYQVLKKVNKDTGLIIKTEQIKLKSSTHIIEDIITSNESAVIIATG